MARVIRTIEHPPRTVAGVAVQVTELIWADGGRSFDVYRADTDELLTADESFDEPPTDEQITICVQQPESSAEAS